MESKRQSDTPLSIQLGVARQHVAQWQATKASAELTLETVARFRELGIPDERMEADAKVQLQKTLAALGFVEERARELEQKLALEQGEAEGDGAEG